MGNLSYACCQIPYPLGVMCNDMGIVLPNMSSTSFPTRSISLAKAESNVSVLLTPNLNRSSQLSNFRMVFHSLLNLCIVLHLCTGHQLDILRPLYIDSISS